MFSFFLSVEEEGGGQGVPHRPVPLHGLGDFAPPPIGSGDFAPPPHAQGLVSLHPPGPPTPCLPVRHDGFPTSCRSPRRAQRPSSLGASTRLMGSPPCLSVSSAPRCPGSRSLPLAPPPPPLAPAVGFAGPGTGHPLAPPHPPLAPAAFPGQAWNAWATLAPTAHAVPPAPAHGPSAAYQSFAPNGLPPSLSPRDILSHLPLPHGLGFSGIAATAAMAAQSASISLARWWQFCDSISDASDRAQLRLLPAKLGIALVLRQPADAPLQEFAEFSDVSRPEGTIWPSNPLFGRASSRAFDFDWAFLLDALMGWLECLLIIFGRTPLHSAIAWHSLQCIRRWMAARWPPQLVAAYIEAVRRDPAGRGIFPALAATDAFPQPFQVLTDGISANISSSAIIKKLSSSTKGKRDKEFTTPQINAKRKREELSDSDSKKADAEAICNAFNKTKGCSKQAPHKPWAPRPPASPSLHATVPAERQSPFHPASNRFCNFWKWDRSPFRHHTSPVLPRFCWSALAEAQAAEFAAWRSKGPAAREATLRARAKQRLIFRSGLSPHQRACFDSLSRLSRHERLETLAKLDEATIRSRGLHWADEAVPGAPSPAEMWGPSLPGKKTFPRLQPQDLSMHQLENLHIHRAERDHVLRFLQMLDVIAPLSHKHESLSAAAPAPEPIEDSQAAATQPLPLLRQPSTDISSAEQIMIPSSVGERYSGVIFAPRDLGFGFGERCLAAGRLAIYFGEHEFCFREVDQPRTGDKGAVRVVLDEQGRELFLCVAGSKGFLFHYASSFVQEVLTVLRLPRWGRAEESACVAHLLCQNCVLKGRGPARDTSQSDEICEVLDEQAWATGREGLSVLWGLSRHGDVRGQHAKAADTPRPDGPTVTLRPLVAPDRSKYEIIQWRAADAQGLMISGPWPKTCYKLYLCALAKIMMKRNSNKSFTE
eukprot:g15972.t1